MNEITLTRPDDWHLHLRDGAALPHTCADTARYMGRAIVMPNLVPPVQTVADAKAYRGRIQAAMANAARQFDPLMTLYLTDQTTPEMIRDAKDSGFVKAVKLYPAGATTNSAAGVAQLDALYPTLEAMQEHDLPLLVHGEVTDPSTDIFDREALFIEQQLAPLCERLPHLRVVFEHITTADAADFVREANDRVAATITVHHLLYNRNELLVGGIKPHYYCLPVLKRRRHQEALVTAATSGNPKFFLGTDSAPHATTAKESPCGCAGIYSAHAAIELYAEVFEAANALDKLEDFASHFGPDFYQLARSNDTITLKREPWEVPAQLPFGDDVLTPLHAGHTISWRVVE